MNEEEQFLKLIEDNNRIVTTKKITRNDINRVFLTRLVNEGQLKRVKGGLYVLPSTWGDEYFHTKQHYVFQIFFILHIILKVMKKLLSL